jgi:hypothetical protein
MRRRIGGIWGVDPVRNRLNEDGSRACGWGPRSSYGMDKAAVVVEPRIANLIHYGGRFGRVLYDATALSSSSFLKLDYHISLS